MWLPIQEVIEINRAAVEATGEPFLVLSYGLLESALDRARNHFWYNREHDVLTLAVILPFAISRNHAFQQGNKRTGFIAASMFLNLNGFRLTIEDSEDLGEFVTAVLENRISEKAFTRTLATHVEAIPDDQDLGQSLR